MGAAQKGDDGDAGGGSGQLSDLGSGLKAVHFGHLAIHEDDVEGELLHHLQSFAPVAGDINTYAGLSQ
jgi:hypothetical protein